MVKRNAASAVRNRIPASVDVMMWTVMNMQRSVKNMKLIDADELKLLADTVESQMEEVK